MFIQRLRQKPTSIGKTTARWCTPAAADAQWAWNNVNSPPSEMTQMRGRINCDELCNDFDKYLHQFITHPLDELVDPCNSGGNVASCQQPPQVHVHKMSNAKQGGNIAFDVVTVADPVSEEFLTEIFETMNHTECLDGERGARGCYICIVSKTDPPTPFVIGQRNPVLCSAVPPNPLEMKLFQIAEHLVDLQLNFLKLKNPCLEEREHSLSVDQIQEMVADLKNGSFAGHSDIGFSLNSKTGDVTCIGN